MVSNFRYRPLYPVQLSTFRPVDTVKLKLKKENLSDFESGMVVGSRRARLRISETADLQVVQSSLGLRMARKEDEMKRATGLWAKTKGSTHYNHGMQKTICESTTRKALKLQQKTTPGCH